MLKGCFLEFFIFLFAKNKTTKEFKKTQSDLSFESFLIGLMNVETMGHIGDIP